MNLVNNITVNIVFYLNLYCRLYIHVLSLIYFYIFTYLAGTAVFCFPSQIFASPSNFSSCTSTPGFLYFFHDFHLKRQKARLLKSHWLAFKTLSTHDWWFPATFWRKYAGKVLDSEMFSRVYESNVENREKTRQKKVCSPFSVDSGVYSVARTMLYSCRLRVS